MKAKHRKETSVAIIRSEGDLEIVVLHETHSALSEIIGPELYAIGGEPLEQSAMFHTKSNFNLFLILVVEFFAEGPRNVLIEEKYQNWSLLNGLRWFCTVHPEESAPNLEVAVSNLEGWLKREVPFTFWCPEVDTQVRLSLSNAQLVSFGANAAKHHLLRLANLLGRLERLCVKAGYSFSPQELYPVLANMITEANSRLLYHSTWILELLGNLFLTLNAVIIRRFNANPTNRVKEMTFPEGVTSDVFQDLYGDVLIFKRYTDERIRKHTPVTTRYLKMRYQ